jgi:hypothetical protein
VRAFIHLRGYSVAVNRRDLSAFIDRWPCSGLIGLLGVTFTFAPSGDVVDVAYRNGNADRWDGPALSALCDDAQAYAEGRPLFREFGHAPRTARRLAFERAKRGAS